MVFGRVAGSPLSLCVWRVLRVVVAFFVFLFWLSSARRLSLVLERPVLLAHTSHAYLIRVLAGQALQATDGLQLLEHVQNLLVLLWILAK